MINIFINVRLGYTSSILCKLILGIFTKPWYGMICVNNMRRNTFITNLAETKKIMPNTVYCISNWKNNRIYVQRYKIYAKILHYLLFISNQMNFSESRHTWSFITIECSLTFIKQIPGYILSICCKINFVFISLTPPRNSLFFNNVNNILSSKPRLKPKTYHKTQYIIYLSK